MKLAVPLLHGQTFIVPPPFSLSPPPPPKEIGRVRKDMYNDTLNGGMFNGRDMEELPEAVGPVAQLQEKLFVPVKEYPDVSGQISDL